MKLSTRSRYALRLLVDFSEQEGGGYTALRDAASRQNISKKYLEQIVVVLSQAGLISASRGFQGGYRLSRPAEEISLGDILRATERGLEILPCLDDPDHCCRSGSCASKLVWKGLRQAITEYADGVSLKDIAEKQSAMTCDFRKHGQQEAPEG